MEWWNTHADNTQICCGYDLSRISSCEGAMNIIKHLSLFLSDGLNLRFLSLDK